MKNTLVFRGALTVTREASHHALFIERNLVRERKRERKREREKQRERERERKKEGEREEKKKSGNTCTHTDRRRERERERIKRERRTTAADPTCSFTLVHPCPLMLAPSETAVIKVIARA